MSVIFSIDPRNIRKAKPTGICSGKNGFSLKGDNGSTVILIHGLTGTPNEMRYVGNFLHKNGYSVVCPRLANHGEPMNVLKYTRWQEFYETVRKLITKGEVTNEKGPIFASGLSMGALLSLLLADEFKDKVAGVSCLAPTLFYDGWNTTLATLFFPLAYTPIRRFFYVKEDPPYGIKNEIIRQRIHRYYKTASLDNIENVEQYGYPYFPVDLLYQLQLLVKYLARRLPRMRFPVQLIQAKDDDMTSVKNSKYIYDRIGSEIKEMVLLYDSYHVITADHERYVVAEKTEDFFSRIRNGHKGREARGEI